MVLALPVTRTRLSHALKLRVGGRTIGAAHMFSPSQSRVVEAEWENGPNENGLPRDLVPQAVERREVRLARYDLYPLVMEEIFGNRELVNLTDQFRPFTMRELWGAPGAGLALVGAVAEGAAQGVLAGATAGLQAIIAGSAPRQYEYTNCWLTDVGRTIDAKSDRVVSVEATVAYLTRERIL